MIWIKDKQLVEIHQQNTHLQVNKTPPRAQYGYMDWSCAAVVTLGVAEFLLEGPTESRRRCDGRWGG